MVSGEASKLARQIAVGAALCVTVAVCERDAGSSLQCEASTTREVTVMTATEWDRVVRGMVVHGLARSVEGTV